MSPIIIGVVLVISHFSYWSFLISHDYHHCDQGRIACANVLSDLYAMGVVDCHNMLMLLAGGLDDNNDDTDDDDEDSDDEHCQLFSPQWPKR